MGRTGYEEREVVWGGRQGGVKDIAAVWGSWEEDDEVFVEGGW